MLTLVDGYNVTKSDPVTRDLTLEAQRDALVARLRVRGRELLGSGRVVVVFDAAEGLGLSGGAQGGVEVRFASRGSADDAIVSLAAGSTGKIVVVTSDRGLADRVKAHLGSRCEVRPREALFEEARPARKRRGRRYPAGSVGIPAGGNSITEELKKLWLDEEE